MTKLKYIEESVEMTEEDWEKIEQIIMQYRTARKTRHRPFFRVRLFSPATQEAIKEVWPCWFAGVDREE